MSRILRYPYSILFIIGCFLFYSCNNSRSTVSKFSALNIPHGVREIKYSLIPVSEDEKYPYIFIAKFRCDSADFKLLSKPLVNSLDTLKINDTAIFSPVTKMFKGQFWSFYSFNKTFPKWWDIEGYLDEGKLFANYLYSHGDTSNIGTVKAYNGRIVAYYSSGVCYLLAEHLNDESSTAASSNTAR